MTVNLNLVELALQRADGTTFEKFANAFFSSLVGVTFIPLGGHHDGGADAFSEPSLFETDKVGHFWQFSVEKTFESKIRRTADALLKAGRTPVQITYCTSLVISKLDLVEDQLSQEIGSRIKIRDQKFITSQINNSPQTIESYNSFLAPLLSFLKKIGGTSTLSYTPDFPVHSLCVFLGQELERRRNNTEILESVTDSLIIWSLEGTDPEKNVFVDRNTILNRILTALPAAKQFIKGALNTRLTALASKKNTDGREIRWYKKEDKFCLPFETRLLIENENTEDEILKKSVSDVFERRAAVILSDDNSASLLPDVIEVCHRALEITFIKQGLEVSRFVLGQGEDTHLHNFVSENVDVAVTAAKIDTEHQNLVRETALVVLRQAFYQSEEVERQYLGKLSRTYTLLLILRNEPRIVEYFRTMSAKLVLYVGSDLLIRAISEYFLHPEDRMTWNTFKILKAAGAKLILSQNTLEEVVTHVRASDLEFKNHYTNSAPYMTLAISRHIDRILIRSYFYARLDDKAKNRPDTWAQYVGMFCTYATLHHAEGQESFRRYLCEEFGLDYEDSETMLKGVDQAQLDNLKDAILQVRQSGKHKDRADRLAYNDALHVLRVFAKRRELNDRNNSSNFGYRTWWLTQESVILKATGDLVASNGGYYMMRPEFILNFIALSPSADDIRKSFETIFPSLLGVRLSDRVDTKVFDNILESMNEAAKLGEARARVLAGELSDKLKGDQYKQYEASFKH